MDDQDAPLLDIFASGSEPARSGWLAWGTVAGAVAFAGLAVTAAVWNMAPSRGRGAGASEYVALVPTPAEAQKPPEYAPSEPTAAPDDREAAPPTGRELADLTAELPASWRVGVLWALPEADPWIMPDLPFVESLPLVMALEAESPLPPEPGPPTVPPAPAGAPPTAALNSARPATAAAAIARTAKARPSEAAGNAARCRGAVAAAQIGEDLSRTDLALMRARCAQ